MTAKFNAGYPLYLDGAFYPAAAWRQFDGGTAVTDTGTAAATSPAGGVYPGAGTPLLVTAGAGMTVLVAAGYCAIADVAGTGVYRFGLLTQATLTVAANSSGATRKDYVLANIQDLNTTGSFAQVEYVTGTTSPPAVAANSVILALVSVPSGAAAITSGMIGDLRAWVTAPGTILPVTSIGAAPVVPSGQLMFDLTTGKLIYSPFTVVSTVLTTSGSWTCPVGTSAVNVRCYGAGAGGTSPGGTGLNGSGGGGGGGEYAAEPALAVTAGQSYGYTVGPGGQGGAVGVFVGSGGTTQFTGASLLVTAHGGVNNAGLVSQGGPGGTGSTNSHHADGGPGGSSVVSYEAGGGGGAAGSSAGTGKPGHAASPGLQGIGGIGEAGGGSGGTGGSFGAAQRGFGPGGGGGGAGRDGSAGGNGADGQILLSYVIAPGPSAYPLTPASQSWFTFDGPGGVLVTATGALLAVTSVTMTADGSSDYVFHAGVRSLKSTGGNVAGLMALVIDGHQADVINLSAVASGAGVTNWTWFTSGAQGTRLAAGPHTVSLYAGCSFGTVQVLSPAFIRVSRAYT